MDSLSDEVVFTIGSVRYRLPDIVHAARVWGDLAGLEEAVREGMACVNHAAQEGSLPTDVEVEAAASDFRYARDLVAADEMHAWLDHWGLDVEAWTAYLERRLLRQRWADEVADILLRHPVSQAEIAEAIHAEGICSGEYGRVAQKLAARLAACEWAREEGGLAESDTAVDEPVLARLDAAVERLREHVLTPAAIRAEVAARHLDWVRVDGQYVAFPDLPRAREAVLCVREDGRTLSQVAADAQTVLHPARFYLEDVEPAWRDQLLGARPGDLVGPLGRDSEFVVLLVTRKVLPVQEDTDVHGRAESTLLERALQQEMSHRVKWHRRP